MRLQHDNRPATIATKMFFSLTVIISVVALALDGGRMMDERRQVQAAADAAALAASGELYKNYGTQQGTDPQGKARDAALRLAKANGYEHGVDGTTVTVSVPPTTGPHAGKPGYVGVVVRAEVRATFSAIFQREKLVINADAVGRGRNSEVVGILTLQSSGADSFKSSGNGVIDVIGGSAYVNSSDSKAMLRSGNATMSANSFEVVGGADTKGTSGITGPIRTGVSPKPDPLASLPVPSMSGMPVRSTSKLDHSSDGVRTLEPGVYHGGIALSSKGTLILNPGVYYINGGGFAVSGQGTVTGNGVFIYNTAPNPSDTGQFLFSGQSTVTLRPPLTGAYAGITYFQNRAATAKVQVSGNGSLNILGTIYAAGANAQVSGNGTTNVAGAAYVVHSMEISGNGTVTVDTGSAAPRTRQYGLVD